MKADEITTAKLILRFFAEFHTEFRAITLRAPSRFRNKQWRAMQLDTAFRLRQYKDYVSKAVKEATCLPGFSSIRWYDVRKAYHELISKRDDKELTETWFNSVVRKILPEAQGNEELLFVRSGFAECRISGDTSVYTDYIIPTDWHSFIWDLLHHFFPGYTWENPDRDLQWVVQKLQQRFESERALPKGIQILNSLFYRNKAVYIIGRFLGVDGTFPIALPIIHGPQGLFIDACLTQPDHLRIIFSYTRAYFLVDTPVPSQTVAFLLSIMPGKDLAEIYNAIGYHKHGKTEQYRLMLDYLDQTDEHFVEAPGIRGLVMTVFTLPGYNHVFKIIKDAFEPPKYMSRETVKEKYRLVKKLDRVGRLADTHEYDHFRLPYHRFSRELLLELRACIPAQLHIHGEHILFQHLYTERKSIPLNIYLEEANRDDALKAALDYGQAIKDMAAANIFPGDMLTKNFGVTRHGRCVFYDYDEIVLLTSCHFRKKPKAETYEQIYASSPWYDIGPDDIFPEEFRFFMIGRADIREEFERTHGDLYTAEWWQDMQMKIHKGEFLHAFPYPAAERFRPEITP